MNHRNILIVIPARGGSKGIPKKNIYPINGKPLILYTIDVALKAELDGDIVVSTDSDEIASVVNAYTDLVRIIKRPEEISGDNAPTESALLHALDYMKDVYGKEYSEVITLQATSPFRKPETLKKFVFEYYSANDEYDAQLTLTEDRTDFWIKNSTGEYERLQKNAPRRRQDREPLYIENSSIYITNVSVLRETKSVLGKRTAGFIIDSDESLDINEFIDIQLAELIFLNRSKSRDNASAIEEDV